MNFGAGVLPLVAFILLFISTSQGTPQADYRNRNLIPFPRVGRSGDVSLDIASPDYMKFDEYTNPKVRRTGTKTMSTGLWFGPRLGRIQKRKDNYNMNEAMRYLLLRDLASYKSTPKYTPRLGRESEELFENLSQNNPTTY